VKCRATPLSSPPDGDGGANLGATVWSGVFLQASIAHGTESRPGNSELSLLEEMPELTGRPTHIVACACCVICPNVYFLAERVRAQASHAAVSCLKMFFSLAARLVPNRAHRRFNCAPAQKPSLNQKIPYISMCCGGLVTAIKGINMRFDGKSAAA
jgi:hypothetical protein